MKGVIAAVVFLLCLLGVSPRAGADIETQGAQASIRFPLAGLPATLTSPEFTVFVWCRPTNLAAEARAILQVPGLMSLRIEADHSVSATITRNGTSYLAAAPVSLIPNEWCLLAVSLRRTDGRFYVFAQSESAALKVGAVTVPGLAGLGAGPPTAGMAIGALPGGLSAAEGLYGMIAVRTKWISAADFSAIWTSRRHWAPFDGVTTGFGGTMGGRAACVWMTNHAMTTAPIDGGTGQGAYERAAVVGQPVGPGNVHVYTTTSWYARLLNVVLPVTAAGGFVYRSHSEPPYDGFFIPDLPGSGLVQDVVPRPSPRARELVTGPIEPLLVMVSSNSRGMGGQDGSAFAPSNYAHGFIERDRSQVMGILLRPAILSSGGGTWFGFDTQPSNPPQSETGTIDTISGNPSPAGTFSRFWTGSMSGTALGPGDGLLLKPGAYHGMRCKPEPGSLIRADAPLTVAAYVLRFPGSSSVTWRSDKGVNPGADGSLGPGTEVSLDSTAWTRVLQGGDHMQGAAAVVVSGDHRALVHPGDACYVAAGAGAGCISVITAVSFAGGATTIQFSHPFFETPGTGSTLLVGPWEFQRLDYPWPGLPASDPEVWRGLRLQAGPGGGVVVFSYSAWRPGVVGYAFGTAGWGGHGYQQQIDESFPGSIAALSAAIGSHVWVQVPAQQWSTPASMSAYTQLLRQGSPGTEIVWARELQHSTEYPADGPEAWAQYIVDHAAAEGVVGLNSFEDPRLGDFRQQLAAGLRKDGEHLSQHGNRVQADVWTSLLERAALDSCRADLNGDGVLNLADFGRFQTLFAVHDFRADFNSDGVLNLADFGAYQTAFALGCS